MFFHLLLLLLSCKSAPEIVLEKDTLPLGTGASVYIFANVKEARPILNLLPIEELNNRQAKQMLDRTDFAAAAMFPQESGQRFQLAAWGKYPGISGLAFTFDKNWKKKRTASGKSFWYSNKLSISMSSRQAFAAISLNDVPADPLAAGAQIPEDFNAFRRNAPLSCWLENPAPVIDKILNEAGLPGFPVQKLFINIFPAGENYSPGLYEAIIRLQFENASLGFGMAAILRMAGGFAANNIIASLFLANPPVHSGRNVDIKTAPLSEEELLFLFNTLLSTSAN